MQSQAITIFKNSTILVVFRRHVCRRRRRILSDFLVRQLHSIEFYCRGLGRRRGHSQFRSGHGVGANRMGYVLHQRHLKSLVFFSAVAGIGGDTVFSHPEQSVAVFCLVVSGRRSYSAVLAEHSKSLCGLFAGNRCHHVVYLVILRRSAWLRIFYLVNGLHRQPQCRLSTAFYLVPACYLILAALIGYDWYQHGNYANS